MELANRLPTAFAQEPPYEKRRMLKHVHSNSTWADAILSVGLAQRFNTLAETANPQNDETPSDTGSEGATSRMVLRMGSVSNYGVGRHGGLGRGGGGLVATPGGRTVAYVMNLALCGG